MSILDNRQFEVSEVICVKCYKRWIAARERGILLKDIECPNCGPGYVINTGQTLDEITCKKCIMWNKGKCKLNLTDNDIYKAEVCDYYEESNNKK